MTGSTREKEREREREAEGYGEQKKAICKVKITQLSFLQCLNAWSDWLKAVTSNLVIYDYNPTVIEFKLASNGMDGAALINFQARRRVHGDKTEWRGKSSRGKYDHARLLKLSVLRGLQTASKSDVSNRNLIISFGFTLI